LVGAKSRIPFGEPKTLLRYGKALGEMCCLPQCDAEAISNRHSQGPVVRLVCSLNGWFLVSISLRTHLW